MAATEISGNLIHGLGLTRSKIGLYGGTFDPIHNGHLNLAVELMESRGLAEVWFIPASVNPFKEGKEGLSPEHRLAMLKLALEPFPGFKTLDWEVSRPGPSYTVDTVQEACHRFPHHEFTLLLGEDCVSQFSQWKDSERLRGMVSVVAGCRVGCGDVGREVTGIEVVPTRVMEIEATWLRGRLVLRKPCAHLLPAKVLDYILDNQLYCL